MKNFVLPRNGLDIFTDASSVLSGGSYIGSSGAIAVYNDEIIDELYTINESSTNNNAEIRALLNGVTLAIKYRNNFNFEDGLNIFSDSENSICGVRDRIYLWRYIPNVGLLTKANTLVANQEVYMEIVYAILQYSLRINFYHQKGHVIPHSTNLQHAQRIYKRSNQVVGRISTDFIKYISKWNEVVDQESRYRYNSMACDSLPRPAIEAIVSNFDRKKYHDLTRLRN